MKRGIICVLLFAFVISAAAVSTAVICKRAASLLDALETTSDLLNNKEYAQAAAQAEQTEAQWKKSSLAFFVFLDHQTFSELDVLMPELTNYLAKDKKAAKEQLIRCEGILRDMIAHQKVSIGNIL